MCRCRYVWSPMSSCTECYSPMWFMLYYGDVYDNAYVCDGHGAILLCREVAETNDEVSTSTSAGAKGADVSKADSICLRGSRFCVRVSHTWSNTMWGALLRSDV